MKGLLYEEFLEHLLNNIELSAKTKNEIEKILTPPTFDFAPKEHWELAETNGWLDFKRGVKLSKSRFTVLRFEGVKLARALINDMIKFNEERGFGEVVVPYIVNRQTLIGTGQLPKFEDDLFKIEGEELFLIPTAEVPLTNLFRDEIIKDFIFFSPALTEVFIVIGSVGVVILAYTILDKLFSVSKIREHH